jgi:GNAT superfamily N-acetyltransferase
MTMFADLALAQRLERTEGSACMQFAAARKRLFPESAADWMEVGGAIAVFDGVGSPVTQCFGLGIFEALTGSTLDTIEQFFFDRGATADLEISPLAGVPAVDLLCLRHYRPIEMSSVMYRGVERPEGDAPSNVRARVCGDNEVELWNEISARGWAHDRPDFLDYLRESGAIMTARAESVSFLAEFDGRPGAAGSLCIHGGVALFAGAATAPEFRRRGLQGALLRARMEYAADHGCDIAMMVAEPGSNSQRNAERKGFRIAYTRTKWQLHRTAMVTPS